MAKGMSVLLQIASFLALSAHCTLAIDTEECRKLGFTGLQLCADCELLASYVKDAELVADCQRCCTAGKSAVTQRYVSAVLEAYLDRIDGFPHIETFVRDKAAAFSPAVKVRNRYGTLPRLILTAKNGAKEIVFVDGWKTEHLEEFLNDKVLRDSDKEAKSE